MVILAGCAWEKLKSATTARIILAKNACSSKMETDGQPFADPNLIFSHRGQQNTMSTGVPRTV